MGRFRANEVKPAISRLSDRFLGEPLSVQSAALLREIEATC